MTSRNDQFEKWLAACPVVVAAIAYSWILREGFRGDDLGNLYLIANDTLLTVVLTPFGGHALVVRNLTFWLTRHAFGLHPGAFMTTVLLTHLANVWLCYRLSLRLTNDVFAAGTAATLWGTATDAAGTLSWYSVYGQVMATTVLAGMLLALARSDKHAGLTPKWLAALLAWSVVGAFSFGTGLAVALVLPFVVVMVRPGVLARRSNVVLLASAPPVVTGLYCAYMWAAIRFARLDPVAPQWQLAFAKLWWINVQAFGRLALIGPANLVVGLLAPGGSPPIAGALIWILIPVIFVAVDTERRRWILGLLLCSLAAYGMIAAGRGWIAGSADATRYHYLAQFPFAVVVAIAIARATANWGFPRVRMLAASSALVLGCVVIRGAPPPSPAGVFGPDFEAVHAMLEAASRSTAPDEPIYVRNRAYGNGGPVVGHVSPGFPGLAAYFCMVFPDNAVSSHPVRFVEPRAEVRSYAARGARSATLFVEEAPPGATVW